MTAQAPKKESIPFTTDPKKLLEKMNNTKTQTLDDIYLNIWKGGLPGIYDKSPDVCVNLKVPQDFNLKVPHKKNNLL